MGLIIRNSAYETSIVETVLPEIVCAVYIDLMHRKINDYQYIRNTPNNVLYEMISQIQMYFIVLNDAKHATMLYFLHAQNDSK